MIKILSGIILALVLGLALLGASYRAEVNENQQLMATLADAQAAVVRFEQELIQREESLAKQCEVRIESAVMQATMDAAEKSILGRLGAVTTHENTVPGTTPQGRSKDVGMDENDAVLDVDAALPDAINRLLDEAYCTATRGACIGDSTGISDSL